MLDLAKVKAVREKLGMSQEDAAHKAGMSGRQQWSEIERGVKANVSLETLGRIAAALGVKARDLLK